ncbi:hypothetical protein G4177_29515 [Corallococcus sp. ZKHCc1 1396]|uniref:Uncharacterized protein n=1 Tax=Corallococcus soli TaxID=2710757 RepID=A0ABR9PWK4_9BACT|nr:hypothetical protein [Corallococcus soli]MBE4752312.1 hypothetical protein [Corallococcus soli]
MGSSLALAGEALPTSRSEATVRQEGLAARANALLARIHDEGLVSVTLRTQDPVEVGLLRLLSQFDGTFAGTAEARALLALRPATARPLSILAEGRPAPAPGPMLDTLYTVTVRNLTSADWFDIVVFYKRVGLSGVVYLEAFDVQPNAAPVFQMGVCSQMESYVVGFFIGDDLVAQIPSSGNMTPTLASIYNPSDIEPCADSWSIAD